MISLKTEIVTPSSRRYGQKSFFTLPYAYLASRDLASDFWTLRLVEE